MRDRAQTNSGFADVVRLAQRRGCLVNGIRKNDYGGAVGLTEIIVGVVVLGFSVLWIVAAIWAITQIRLAIKTKSVSAKLVIAVFLLVYVAYKNFISLLL